MSKKRAASKKSRRQKARKAQKQSKKRPVLLIGILLLLVGGYVGYPYVQSALTPTPEVVRPAAGAEIDPAVQASLKSKWAAVEGDPRNVATHADLGLMYEANGLWKEAQQSYANASTLDPSAINWHLRQAITARQAGDFDTALAILKTWAPKHKNNKLLQNHYADALLEAGELEAAEDAFNHLHTITGGIIQSFVGLGDVNLQQGNTDAAIQMLEQGLRKDPSSKQAHYLLGRAYAQAGRTEEAEIKLAQGEGAKIVYLRDPQDQKLAQYTVNVTGRISQASAQMNGGNPQNAATLLEETYAHHNTNVMYLNTLASAYLKTSRLDEAHRLLERARSLDETSFYTYLNLYTWALRSGQKERALSFADSAVSRAPERDDTHLSRAQALAELGRLDEATESAQKALEINGNKAGNHGLVGDLLFRNKQYSQAKFHLQKALELNGRLLPAMVALADTHWQLNEKEEARKVLQAALSANPNHPQVQQLASRLQ